MELTIDWLWLTIQIVLLFIIIINEIRKPSNRNLYAIVLSSTMLVLVQFQAWWVLTKFQNPTGGMRHIEQWLSIEGIRLANFYSGLATISTFVTYLLLSNKKYSKSEKSEKYKNLDVESKLGLSKISFLVILVWTIISSILLISLLGGLQAAVDNPGSVVGGQTMLLIAVSLGKIPLLDKVITKKTINSSDIYIFAYTILITLFNSRFSATFILIQLMLALNYCRKEVPRYQFLLFLLIGIIIFFGFGIYRDNASINEGATIAERLNNWSTKFGDDEDTPIEWFYRAGVEGFTGLAGILTYEKSIGGLNHDFGLSNLSTFTQLIPNFIRTDPNGAINQISNFLRDIYPYPNGSIVPPGLEAAYAHFGLLGIILFGITLGYLMCVFHEKMIFSGNDHLLYVLISIQSALFIRSTIRSAVFFGLGDFFILLLYRRISLLKKII